MDNPGPPHSKCSKDCSSHEKAGFDRLKPRNSTHDMKRKLTSSSDQKNEDDNGSKVRKVEFKREYSKLRKLVPALNARNDITKVEIIEETIRYIDALHHQLAARMHSQNSNSTSDEQINEPKREAGKPLRQLDGSGQTSTKDNTESSTSSNLNFSTHSRSNNDNSSTLPTSAAISIAPSTSSIANNQTSSAQETSIKDLKAAVENIQKLFSIHLMESQQDGDDT